MQDGQGVLSKSGGEYGRKAWTHVRTVGSRSRSPCLAVDVGWDAVSLDRGKGPAKAPLSAILLLLG